MRKVHMYWTYGFIAVVVVLELIQNYTQFLLPLSVIASQNTTGRVSGAATSATAIGLADNAEKSIINEPPRNSTFASVHASADIEKPSHKPHQLDCTKACHDLLVAIVRLEMESGGSHAVRWKKCHCEQLFCNQTLSDPPANLPSSMTDALISCQWSHVAIQALVEQSSQSDYCTTPQHLEAFYPPDEWLGYNFGDFFKRKVLWGDERWDQNPKKPGSLMEAFYNHAKAHYDTSNATIYESNKYRILTRVVKERLVNMTKTKNNKRDKSNLNAIAKPEPNTLVIHLRIGDVVDTAAESVAELLQEQRYYWRRKSPRGKGCCANPWEHPDNPPFVVPYNAYVRPLSHYHDQLQQHSSNNYSSVVLMGSAHKGEDVPHEFRNASKSCHYTRALQAYISTVWPHADVTLRLGQSPDGDMLFVAQAAGFLESGGGYSKILKHLQKTIAGRINLSGRVE